MQQKWKKETCIHIMEVNYFNKSKNNGCFINVSAQALISVPRLLLAQKTAARATVHDRH